MPGLDSMRRRLSSIAKPPPATTTPPPHTHPDTRLLEPDFFNIDADDLTWFHKINLAVRRDIAQQNPTHAYMHIQRVTVSAYTLYLSEKHPPSPSSIDARTIVVAAMVHSLGAAQYAADVAENAKAFGSREPHSPDAVQSMQHELLFGYLRGLDCPPDVAGPAALMASLVWFAREVGDQGAVSEHCEAYPALGFVLDAVRLDELGCVGIARAVGEGRGTVLGVVDWMDTRLVHYVGLMKTKGGRREAEKRWAQMLEFREGLLGQTDCSVGLKVE